MDISAGPGKQLFWQIPSLCEQRQTHAVSLLKKTGSTQLWNTSNGIFQTKRTAKVELNFFDYSDSKNYYSEPDVVDYEKNSKL